MMSLRLPLLALVLLGTSACTMLDRRETPAAVSAPGEPPPPVADVVREARDLAAEGRWSAAVERVDDAQRRHPGDTRLADEKTALEDAWRRFEHETEDRILVGDAENLQRRIALLEQLARADPADLVVTSRRIYWRELLGEKLAALTACGERHAADRPKLARRCYDVASALPADAVTEQRLAGVSRQLQASEQVAAERRRVKREKSRQRQARTLLDDARRAIDRGEYRAALDTLQQVAALQPDNREAAGLRQEALRRLGPRIEALVKLGDHLYLDEQIEAAIATWQAALVLQPDDEEIEARVERARTVLRRLEALREQQQYPAGGH